MFIAKVVGNVVATRKNDTLVGYKLMIIQPINAKGEKVRNESVAADYVGAGIGELVLVGSGSSVPGVFSILNFIFSILDTTLPMQVSS